MAFDMTNFVIDHILRGIAFARGDEKSLGVKEGDVLFSINQITNPSLSCTSESNDAVDALSVPIATFYRAKNAEFSAENALFDMNLMATQSGTKKRVAGEKDAQGNNITIKVPYWATIDVAGKTYGDSAVTATVQLNRSIPNDEKITKAYILKGDGTLAKQLNVNTTASGRTDISISGNTVGFVVASKTSVENADKDNPVYDGFLNGEQIIIMSEYEADGASGNGAVEISNTATGFPVGCKFIMEILGVDVCRQTDLLYAYLIFPNCKLSPDFDWTIATDSTHPFSMKAMQEYCNKEKKLFSIVIPEDESGVVVPTT